MGGSAFGRDFGLHSKHPAPISAGGGCPLGAQNPHFNIQNVYCGPLRFPFLVSFARLVLSLHNMGKIYDLIRSDRLFVDS